jgi:hypothetical protein
MKGWMMFQTGDIVEVMDHNKARHRMDYEGSYLVEVVSPRYFAGDPLREFVGRAVSGKFAGERLAIQNRHARIARSSVV